MANTNTPAPPATTETVSGMAVSLVFWSCLLLAASLFASVGLATKLAESLRLRDLYAVNQIELVAMERQNEQLRQVVRAIQDDPDFATELTRIEFDAVRPDEEIIPVTASLKLETRGVEMPRTQPALPRAWYRPWIAVLAENGPLRAKLLGAAALLVVISFTWLQPASAERFERQAKPAVTAWQTLRSRYVRPF